MDFTGPSARACLFIAHPGHELVVHGWVERVRPRVFVLTDGSGRTGKSRLGFTAEVLAATRAPQGSVFGRFTDEELYAAILRRDVSVFLQIAEEVAATLVRERLDYIVGDALEGYNPAHDLCRPIVGAACALSSLAHGRQVAQYEFPVVRRDSASRSADSRQWIVFRPDDRALARKIRAARRYSALQGEVETAFTRDGLEAFRVECFRQVDAWAESEGAVEQRPYYETVGEARVASAHYSRVIRQREHVLPLAAALGALARARPRCVS